MLVSSVVGAPWQCIPSDVAAEALLCPLPCDQEQKVLPPLGPPVLCLQCHCLRLWLSRFDSADGFRLLETPVVSDVACLSYKIEKEFGGEIRNDELAFPALMN